MTTSTDLRPYNGNVEGAVYDVVTAAMKSVADIKAALKAGGGSLVETAKIGEALVADLLPTISRLPTVGTDVTVDKTGSAKSAMLAAFDSIDSILA